MTQIDEFLKSVEPSIQKLSENNLQYKGLTQRALEKSKEMLRVASSEDEKAIHYIFQISASTSFALHDLTLCTLRMIRGLALNVKFLEVSIEAIQQHIAQIGKSKETAEKLRELETEIAETKMKIQESETDFDMLREIIGNTERWLKDNK